MANTQIGVNLLFQADTSQAKQQIQSLANDLNALGNANINSFGNSFSKDILEAKTAAKQLGTTLQESLNINTGKLDLNKFNDSLKLSGMTLTDYGNKLGMLGTAGDQAFLRLSQAIIQTEVPLKRTTGLLKQFGTTLANTAKWQISSSILHGFMGAVQQAYGYSQDLDKSLNNIRIVTGQNTEQMAKFAEQANKAAKSLSVSTTDYTDASLIYYQQGLSDQEVLDRTNVTIKMANAAGQSAEVVSDQLTAVWNNFYDGSKSLEYYADVMTALGAATASSTDEIATGLEKFAAVADTVGLSYEYATAALTTVTATTRQSADVVGTAFKTLFARIQDLDLGKTLEDGTNLGAYSEALAKIGVSIKDSSGNLRDMDDILKDMASKWQQIDKDQQVALAQTVAGVRQYTQLIALMDNWDFMEENLSTVKQSTGTLDEQQKIYEESWEASSERVKASLEGVYDSLFDESSFIELNNTLASALSVVEKLVDAIGGMPGLLSFLGVIITRIFKDDLSLGINNALHNFKNFTGASKAELNKLKQEAYEYSLTMTKGLSDSPETQALREHLQRSYEMQKQMEEAVVGTNSAQEQAVREVHKMALEYSEAAVQAKKVAEEAERAKQASIKEVSDKRGSNFYNKISQSNNNITDLVGYDLIDEANNISKMASSIGGAELTDDITELNYAIEDYHLALEAGNTADQTAAFALIVEALDKVIAKVKEATDIWDTYEAKVKEAAEGMVNFETNLGQSQKNISEVDSSEGFNVDQVKKLKTEYLSDGMNKFEVQARNLGLDSTQFKQAESELDTLFGTLEENVGNVEKQKAIWDQIVQTFKQVSVSAESAEEAIEKVSKASTVDKISGTTEKKRQSIKKSKEKKSKDPKAATTKEDKENEKKLSTAKKVTSELDKQDGVTKKLASSIYDAAKKQQQSNQTDEEAKNKKAGLVAEMEKAKKATQDFGSGTTTALQGATSLSMGIQSLQSAWSALENPDLSTFEKFSQILMSVGIGIPSFTSGIKNIVGGLSEMSGALGGSLSALLANALGLDANTLAESNLTKEKMKALGIDKAKQASSAKESLENIKAVAAKTMTKKAEKEVNEEKAKNSALTLSNIALRKMETMAESGGIAAKIAHTAAQWALNGSISPFIALMAAALVAIVAIVAPLAVLTLGIYKLVEAYNADAEALNEANESLEDAKQRYENATQAVEEFKESLNGYEEARENLQSLKDDVEKLNEAVEDSNEKARELIETYGLFGQWSYGDFGEIVIDPEALKDIELKLTQEEQDAKVDKYGASLVQGAAALDSAATNLAREIGTVTESVEQGGKKRSSTTHLVDKENIYSLADAVQAYKEANEDVTPSLEELKKYVEENSASLGLSSEELAIVNSALDNDTYNSLMNFVDSLNQATQAAINYANEILGVSIGNVYGEDFKNLATDSAGNFDEGLYNLIVAAAANLTKDENTATGDTNINQNIQDSYETAKNKVYNEVSNYDAGKNIEDAVVDFAEELLGDTEWIKNNYSSVFGDGASYDGNIDTEQMLNDYLTSQGYTVTSIDDKSGKVTASYTKTDGEIVTDQEFDNDFIQRQWAEEIVNAITRSKTEGQVEEDLQGVDSSGKTFNVNDVFGNIIENGEQYGVDFANSIMAGIANATEGQPIFDFSGIYDQLAPSQYEELMQMDSSEIGELFGLTPEQMEFLGFENAEAFGEAFKQGLEGYSVEDAKENMFKNAGADASEYGLDAQAAEEIAEAFYNMAEAGKEGYEGLNENSEALSDATTRYMRLNNAVLDLSENYTEYSGALKEVQDAQDDVSKALAATSPSAQKLRKSLSDLLGTSEDLINADLLDAIDPKDFEAAARGDEAAIQRIRDSFIELQAEANGVDVSGLKQELAGLEEGAVLDLDTSPFLMALIQAKVNAGASAAEIESMLSGLGLDADITDFVGTLEEAAAITAQETGEMADAMTFTQDTTVDTATVEEEEQVQGTTAEVTKVSDTGTVTFSVASEDGESLVPSSFDVQQDAFSTTYTPDTPTETTDSSTEKSVTSEVTTGDGKTHSAGQHKGVTVNNVRKSVGNNVSSGTRNTANNNVNNATKPSGGSGGGGGGGGSESSPAKPMKKTKRSDVVTRYKEVQDKIDNVTDSLEKLQMLQDTVWGKAYLDNLRQQNKELEIKNKLIQEEIEQIKEYTKEDLNNFKQAAADLGIYDIQVDTETGDILNIEDILNDVWEQIKQAENQYNSFSTAEQQSEFQESTLDPLMEKYELLKEYYDLYSETIDRYEDRLKEALEYELQIKSNNFELWSTELEIRVELNENDLRLIEYQLGKIEEDFYSMAETASLMANDQIQNYSDNVEIYENALASLKNKFKNEEITDSAYKEGLTQMRDYALENAEAILELDRTMKEYYGETLSMAMDELSKYTDTMEHQASTLEHYSNMLSLLGKENDYKKLAVILEGQTKLAESSAKVAKKNLEMLENQKQSILEKYNDALANGNEEAAELYKKQYEDVLEASQEALEEYQSKVEEWTEAIKAELENSMKDIHKTLEEALTGGSSFDKIITQMERAQSLQEEYLTDTNKIYETEKMIRKAQQEIDKTSNTVAKRKLKDFINEQKALQDQVKVSQFELDIQQAKYNLLLARIALEEAQNAKSTVRLQRDSEGNFGYVYTADQNTIADAEQKVADSEQALYQLGIDGANEYTQKRIQITKEMYEALEELAKKYANGEISSQEEYEAERLKIIEYYGEKILDYENLYQIAVSADARILSDAWSTGFQDSIAKGTEFETALTEYLGSIQGAFVTTQEKLKPIIEDTFGLDYENLHSSVDNVVNSNTTLSNQIIDTLIPSLNEEIKKVGEATQQWTNMREQLDLIVKDLEEIAKFATEKINIMSGFGDSDQSFKEEEEKPNNSNNSNNNNNNSNNNNSNNSSSNNNNLSIEWGINQIHKGLWGNGWNNRWEYAKAAGYTKEQFEQIKQYIIDYYNGLYTPPKTQTKTPPKTQTTSTSKPTYLQSDWGQQTVSFNVDSDKVDAASELLAKKLAEEEYLRQMDQKNADIRRRNAARDAASYDTGGYTGEWGSYGKLAILHEKELILNEDDTKNWLTSIQEINKTLELYGKNLQLETRLRSYKMNDYSNGLEQKVYIEASFPSVVEHTEIELAFENLINEASQYAYRFNKN